MLQKYNSASQQYQGIILSVNSKILSKHKNDSAKWWGRFVLQKILKVNITRTIIEHH